MTLEPRLERRLSRGRAPLRDRRHYVYDRADRPCHTCRTYIDRSQHADRVFFHCPTCQPV